MSLKAVPIKNFSGFSDKQLQGAHYFSQGFSKSEFGAALLYSIVKQKDDTDISGLGAIKYFAKAGASTYAQDDNGIIYKEATSGAYDFSAVNSPSGSNGAGLLGDQKGRLLYAGNSALGLYDGSTWDDTFQSLTAWQHPMDTYEDGVYIGNKSTVALLAADDSFNASAFTFPSSFTTDAIKSGVNGILIGTNFGFQGVLSLWNHTTDRSISPWKWTKGKILAIERHGANWVVLTQREVILTNGYSHQTIFQLLDDDLSFGGYETGTILPQRILVVNDTLIILNTAHNPVTSPQFGRMKTGTFMIHIPTGMWNFFPVSTKNTITVDLYSAFADNTSDQRILLGYRDNKLSKSYIGSLSTTGPSTAQFISEQLGSGNNMKVAEAVILGLGIQSSVISPTTLTFNVSVKVYNFKRQLWGRQKTNAVAAAGNKIRVDGTDTTYFKAQIGDEVTVLEGANAGSIGHITLIENEGLSNETWTLDTTFSSATGTTTWLNVQPFKLVEKKVFSNITEIKPLYFDVKNKVKGKKFLIKVVLENMTNVQLELQESKFVYDELTYDAG